MPLQCQTFTAHQWLSARPHASSLLLGTPLTEVKSSGPNRGQGLFAARPIPAFTQILTDTPLVLMTPTDDLPQLYAQFQAFSKLQREVYLALSYTSDTHRAAMMQDKLLQRGFSPDELSEMITVASIMQTNAFNVDLADGLGSTYRAMFAKVARINHACAPNAHVCYYPPDSEYERGKMVVHSLRSLEKGEEVLISYFNFLMPRDDRALRTQKWGFACACPVCDETAPGHRRAEQLRKEFNDFKMEQAKLVTNSSTSAKETSKLERCIARGKSLTETTADFPDLIPALPDVYDGLALLQAKVLLSQNRSFERKEVLVLLERAAVWDAKITGPTSPATAKRLHKLAQFVVKGDQRGKPAMTIGREGGCEVMWSD
ncbi:SET domain-containing protein [Zymoseptoria brevis]|uniref:SET domain-containing protein n=1 Tax=Zymoseptoria brevis TaxID=1047168 RepID=A0A0F4GSI7_9PEZI|nr:SET domain-containing protein [Zymoseptoria brevis]